MLTLHIVFYVPCCALRSVELNFAFDVICQTRHPLNLVLTEAGTLRRVTVFSSVEIGFLLAEGIVDTIRVSLTDEPVEEVRVGLAVLRSLGLRAPGPDVTRHTPGLPEARA